MRKNDDTLYNTQYYEIFNVSSAPVYVITKNSVVNDL